MRADAKCVFALASDTPNWPTILPHYRWVRVRQESPDGTRRIIEMAATRDGIPVRWVAEQRSMTDALRIEFDHVAGATRGMRVAWTLEPRPDGTLVSIWHSFQPDWPLVPEIATRLIVGQFFVDNIAGKTLRRIRHLVER